MANRMGGVGKGAGGDQNEDAHKLQVALRAVFNEVDTGYDILPRYMLAFPDVVLHSIFVAGRQVLWRKRKSVSSWQKAMSTSLPKNWMR